MRLDEAYAHCGGRARDEARDRWLAALFALPSLRPHLHALTAFELEMAHLRVAARDPRAGEIRLVWWREALSGASEDAQANPVAAAMLDTLQKFRPPPHLIANAIVGRQFDLYDDPFPTMDDLEAYLGETRSGVLQIAAFVLSQGGAAEASGLAGVALGMVELLRGLSGPRPLSFAPADVLARHGVAVATFRERPAAPELKPALAEIFARARRRLAEAEIARRQSPKALAPAYAGLATAPLWLDALERGQKPPLAWRRQWALWRWMRRT